MNQEIFWIWLSEIETISLTQKKVLLNKYETPMAIFESCKREFLDLTLLDKAKIIYDFNQKHNIKILTLFDMIIHKPTLKNLPWPILFYYKGNLDFRNSIALLGTRKMSMHGYYYTEQLCDISARSNKVINTGLSDGIEIKTLEHCLENNYHACAFVAHGLHECIPKSKSSLMEKLVNQGVLISPYSVLSKQHRLSLLQRNILLAMWSDELILVEASAGSKSMNTIDYALKFKKIVYSISGPPDSKRCELNNSLLKDKYAIPLKMRLGQDMDDLMNHPISKTLRKKAMSRDELSATFKVNDMDIDDILMKLEFSRIASNKANGKWYYNGW